MEFAPNQTYTKPIYIIPMKTLILFAVILSSITINSVAQIQMESLDLKTPQIDSQAFPFSQETSPLLIAKLDSFEYVIEGLAINTLDSDWIKSVSVLKDSTAIKKYGCKGKNGVIVVRFIEDLEKVMIKLKEGSIVEFDEHEAADSQFESKPID